ncbi:DNA internalization-related competence protein ComEC/Rec2 [Psychrosphaera ytuae]|uniref:DNA internalization-related competence protein ComEC/Rec2 n=1 Tax=Psychrosphaera ytuae TaxID=2820710 RepID=A0A975DC55_9GAMM|nr:DNA internalization-related competence protein ComEC/Rec2 [Psychrosphaera ytuae]QTH64163.1 DNA internalization-related competence protein ComEC/Rec2 [Psychrosphaera ytuae]
MNKLVGGFLIGLWGFLYSPILLTWSQLGYLCIGTFCTFFALYQARTKINRHIQGVLFLLIGVLIGVVFQNEYSRWQLVVSNINNTTEQYSQASQFQFDARVKNLSIHQKINDKSVKKTDESMQNPVKLIVEIEKINGQSVPWYAPGQLAILYWYPKQHHKTVVKPFQQGTLIHFKSAIKPAPKLANDYGFDEYKFYLQKRIKAKLSTQEITESSKATSKIPWQEDKLSTLYRRLFCESCEFKRPALLFSLLTGDKSFLTKTERQQLRDFGVGHLFAVSGLHIGILYFLGHKILSLLVRTIAGVALLICNGHKRASLGFEHLVSQVGFIGVPMITIVFLGWYVWLIGAPPSAIRAWIAVLLWLLLHVSKINLPPLAILLYVATLSVTLDPWLPLSVAWQLSFWAVAGIITFIEYRHNFVKVNLFNVPEYPESKLFDIYAKIKEGFAQLVLFQVFITIWMLPLVVIHFQVVASMSLVNNLIFTPVVSLIIMPLLVVGVLLDAVQINITESSTFHGLVAVADHLIEALWSLGTGITSEISVFTISSDWGLILFLCIGTSLLISSFITKRIRRSSKINARVSGFKVTRAFYLAVVSIVACFIWIQISKSTNSINIFDVGQGSASLITSGNNRSLIDLGPIYRGGSNATERVLKDNLVGLGVPIINQVLITHYDSDHKGDLAELYDVFPYKNPTPCADFETDEIKMQVLWPRPELRDKTSIWSDYSSERNDLSCVMKFTIKASGIRILFSGDISHRVELQLARAHQAGQINMASEIMLSPHHGSSYSSSLPYIYAIYPKLVIHDAGYANRFGFPTNSVIERYQRYGARQVSTTNYGQIRVDLGAGPNSPVKVTTSLNKWSPFWKKQNPFSFHQQIR